MKGWDAGRILEPVSSLVFNSVLIQVLLLSSTPPLLLLLHSIFATAPILFSFCDFLVWFHVTVRYIYMSAYIYIIREATVALLHLNLYRKYRRSIAGETFI